MSTRFGAAIRRIAGIDADLSQVARRADSVSATPMPISAAADSSADQSVREVDSSDPEQHARRLLAWLQSDGGASGEVLAGEIQAAYSEMVAELGWSQLTWLRTGREFAKLTGPRRYRDVIDNGKRRRLLVYLVPAVGEITTDAQRASHPAAPVPLRLTAIEDRITDLVAEVRNLAQGLGAGRGDTEANVVHIDRRG